MYISEKIRLMPVSFALPIEVKKRIDKLTRDYNFRNNSAFMRFFCEAFLFNSFEIAQYRLREKEIQHRNAIERYNIELEKEEKGNLSKCEEQIRQKLRDFNKKR